MVIMLTQKSFSIPLIMVLNRPFTMEKRTNAPILSHLCFALLLQLLGLINLMNLDTYEGFERVRGDKQHEQPSLGDCDYLFCRSLFLWAFSALRLSVHT